MAPSVAVVVVARSIHDATGYTVFTQSRELLFLPLTPRERRVIKPLITGTVRSVAKASGALLSILLRNVFRGGDATSTLGMLIVAVSCVWLGDVLTARREFGFGICVYFIFQN